jgi:hypothetical protein
MVCFLLLIDLLHQLANVQEMRSKAKQTGITIDASTFIKDSKKSFTGTICDILCQPGDLEVNMVPILRSWVTSRTEGVQGGTVAHPTLSPLAAE